MNCDVAVVGSPFLDLVFKGLSTIPKEGEERVAKEFHIAPGGTGIQAIAAARLGLDTVLVAPFGSDFGSGLMREMLDAEGVRISGAASPGATVPVSAVLSTEHGTGFATVLQGAEPRLEDVTTVGPASVITSLGRIELAPETSVVYAVTGALEIDGVSADFRDRVEKVHALILNHNEARHLGGSDLERFAQDLSSEDRTVVVTLGADGAIAARSGSVLRAAPPATDATNETGAGDVFAAAFVWGENRGLALDDTLSWACLYASLFVAVPTPMKGALPLKAFLEEGARRGLKLPHC